MSGHACESSGDGTGGVDDDNDEENGRDGVTDPGCLLWPGCVLSTFPSEALILTQPNEVSVTDSHCSAEDTGACAQHTQLVGNEVDRSQVVCAQSPCSPRPWSQLPAPALPGLPVQPAPGGQGPPLAPLPGASAVIEPGRIFHAGADVPVVGAVNSFAPCFLLCIDPFTVNEITV